MTATRRPGPEENLHYWKLVSEESGCFDSPFPFANDEARFLFSRSSNPNLHYVPHEEYSCTVTLMSGLPGSGKDHWLSKHRRDRPVVSLDSIRQTLDVAPTDNQGVVVQQAQERCREFLRRKVSFAFNATNSVRQTRARWISLFADYNARIEIVYVEPKFDDILKQNQGRIDPVPTEIIEKLASKYEPPTWLDCHQLIIAGND